MPAVQEERKSSISVPTAIAYPILISIMASVGALFLKVNTLERDGAQRESRLAKVEQKQEYTDNRVTALQIEVITKLSEIKVLIEQENDKVPTSRPPYR